MLSNQTADAAASLSAGWLALADTHRTFSFSLELVLELCFLFQTTLLSRVFYIVASLFALIAQANVRTCALFGPWLLLFGPVPLISFRPLIQSTLTQSNLLTRKMVQIWGHRFASVVAMSCNLTSNSEDYGARCQRIQCSPFAKPYVRVVMP